MSTVGRTSAALALALLLAAPASDAAAPRTPSGPLVAVSSTTGRLLPFPRVRGSAVYAIVDDGHGGWFVGGEFSSIGGVACRNLAHVRSGGVVDGAWCPRPDGTVRALARADDVLYLGGLGITRVGGARRSDLAALATGTGRATPWNPGAISRIGDVLQLAVDPPRRQLIVTGEFTRLGGKPRARLAAVGLASGRANGFVPNPDENSHGDSAFGAAPAADAIYAWGFFSRIGGLPRDGFARLAPGTGRALPAIVSPICPTDVLVAGPRLYAGTDTACEGVKQSLIAVALPDLRPVAWNPRIPRSHVEALAAGPGIVVAAAARSHFDQAEPRLVVGVDEAGHREFTSPVHPVGAVQAVRVAGPLVLVGGEFRSVVVSG